MANRLAGKVALVSGGGGGIGSEAGRIFCEEGASVVLVDLSGEAVEAAAERIRSAVPGANVRPFAADLGIEAAAYEAADKAIEAFGGIDIVVNNVGIRRYDALADATWDMWEDIIRVNLLSYASLTRAALPSMRERGEGSVVNVSSCHAVLGRKGMGAYDASKAAVLGFTRTLAWEEAPHGIRANAICPGYTLTPFHVTRAEQAGKSRDELAAFEPPCVLGRWAEPKEMAYPLLWLASDEASYVTGATLMVDGGMPV
ncbi:SDR family NAD(P)-dependent oxidoreductase [Paracoccus denitrificans]|jgi:NAD(P)-dependent dehydrogenase (short-subunit alcohol dehydrogenase family)|uniref:Short-chain dehydrogenase/reductase SDR n=1 Tax=Paracoccus denitrificans (strain Pd 1222) TaxID=318586 RepID=A1AYG4_PARDP|nr:SDR family oxidoreductase [Paracoccus denitrificans]ABL68308.1 short-chain dehydrogenase/reductase SDR [Paracoccus denitrificans PD1222]MBB4627822.1 NAD(P)-dependent dehydrogenase (short-subunit alcohol dehydrogenase family) [Paracoccus denitrificans]MCU7428642.1 SDR family oxidoreductase [Paracoccus denitrificans]UPV95326.1 SDR family oxidoreductase [Paracoccus denitrificans]WQO32616.1 SDR family oxidoreductase [Paracoccus denitrificans]